MTATARRIFLLVATAILAVGVSVASYAIGNGARDEAELARLRETFARARELEAELRAEYEKAENYQPPAPSRSHP